VRTERKRWLLVSLLGRRRGTAEPGCWNIELGAEGSLAYISSSPAAMPEVEEAFQEQAE
jgi:hypothetical protein